MSGDRSRRTPIGGEMVHTCPKCQEFFSKFQCSKSLECDCPRCQGLCECGSPIYLDDPDQRAEDVISSLIQRQDNADEIYRLRLRIIQQEKEIEALRRDKEELRRECSFLRGYREAMRGE